jgi:hypothetical protein
VREEDKSQKGSGRGACNGCGGGCRAPRRRLRKGGYERTCWSGGRPLIRLRVCSRVAGCVGGVPLLAWRGTAAAATACMVGQQTASCQAAAPASQLQQCATRALQLVEDARLPSAPVRFAAASAAPARGVEGEQQRGRSQAQPSSAASQAVRRTLVWKSVGAPAAAALPPHDCRMWLSRLRV